MGLALCLCLGIALTGPARSEEARLTILYTTDLHGALTAYDYLADRPAPRGLTKIASMIAAARRDSVPTLLLDAGDCMQGSPLETFYQRDGHGAPEPMMTAMNRIGYDAMAVGNHEFSDGLETLERARSTARFPWLAANIVRADGTPAYVPALIKSFGSVKVGVVGLCTPAVPSLEDSSNWRGLTFVSPVEAARREVDRLRGQEHCDVVVLLAHTGLERDPVTGVERRGDTPDENWGYRLATEVPGADLVILGHTHVVVPAAEIRGVLVTQAGKWGEHLGRADLVMSREGSTGAWKLASRKARVLAVTDSVAEDKALVAFADPYHRAAQSALSRVIGEAARDIGAPRGRFDDGPLWETIHEAQLLASGAEVSLAALADPAANIRAGAVTVRDAFRAYPFDNTLAVVELTGAELAQVLEQSARYLADYHYESGAPLAEPGMPGYNFDSAEGVGYEIDLTRPAGERIVALTFRGTPLAPDRRLKVAVNSYRLNGGGGFEPIRHAPRLWRTSRTVRDLLVEHIERSHYVMGSFKRNWTLLPDYVSTPERPLIDVLARNGAIAPAELRRIRPDERALRGDLAWWLAHAFGWREKKLSGAFVDTPDSLAPWLDGLLKRRILGESAEGDYIYPMKPIPPVVALDWCERAARVSGYAMTKGYDLEFRLGLLAGLGGGANTLPSLMQADTLTRSQLLGIVSNLRFPTVRVLETTDFHGAILGGTRERRTNRAVGGSAVLAAHIARLRAENPAGTVLIDGGDLFQGTMISNLQFGRPGVEQMNALGYSAFAIGNHEFDWSADTLEQRVHEMNFGALAANLRERKTGRMPRWVRSDTVMTRRGVRIGVFGLSYRFTPTVTLAKHVRHLEFRDDSATAAGLVPRLRARCDVVIGVGHIPVESDSTRHAVEGDLVRLARGVHGVDAWFGGHSHNQVNDRVSGTPVMIAGSHGEVIAVCDFVIDPVKKKIIESRTRLVQTYADEVVPDSAMLARVERWNALVGPIASREVGRNERALVRNRGGESTLGNMVADAMRTAVGAEVALQNSGGLRADLPEGVVTEGRVYEVMPFDNQVFTLGLTGVEIKLALEQALRFGRVTQVGGIRYSFDLSRPELARVVTLTDTAGTALDDARIYRVACNDFMATGGDNYEVLSGGRDRTLTEVLVRNAIEAYVMDCTRRGGSLDVRSDGRIRKTGERKGQGE